MYLGLYIFSSVFSNAPSVTAALLGLNRVANLAFEELFISLLSKVLSCFCSKFRVIIHLHCEARSYHFCSIQLNGCREYSSIHHTIKLPASICLLIMWLINKQWARSIGSHTCLYTACTIFETGCGAYACESFLSFSWLFSPIILSKESDCRTWEALFWCFLVKSYLAFLLLNVISCSFTLL